MKSLKKKSTFIKQINKLQMDRLRDRQNRSWDGIFYSSQRLDLLIVSISGAGIYVCLETLKYLNDKGLNMNCLIKVSGGLFLIAIIVNFISQILNNKSNYEDYLMCDRKLDNIENETDENKFKIKTHKENADKFSKLTVRFNYYSAILMSLGLLLIMTYFLFIF